MEERKDRKTERRKNRGTKGRKEGRKEGRRVTPWEWCCDGAGGGGLGYPSVTDNKEGGISRKEGKKEGQEEGRKVKRKNERPADRREGRISRKNFKRGEGRM